MQSFFHKITKLNCGWNNVPLTEEAFYALARSHKITIQFMPLRVAGFYTCDDKKHYIALNNSLRPLQLLFTMWHEFGHFLMHSPSTDAVSHFCGSEHHSRDEKEADAFAYCALLPLESLKVMEPEEGWEIYGSTFFLEILAVYERYGI